MDIVVTSETELEFGGVVYPCIVGRSGIKAVKSEGDGATPAGRFPLRRVHYRADRISTPETRLRCEPITPIDGWCDAPDHALYNKPVKIPFEASHENLWRDDNLYNVFVDLGYNDDPVVAGKGSAIFFHVASQKGAATEGCVALDQEDLLTVLKNCGPDTFMEIRIPPA